MKVRKAVILAAGFGTRMLPASKAVPKEILPVVDKPAIQLVVEEVVESGIEDIVMVVSPGKALLLNHFGPVPELERSLEERNKLDLLDIVRASSNLATITPVEQSTPLGIGHAVLQARELIGKEPFAVLLPDDIFDSKPPCLRQLLNIAEEQDGPVVALLKVAHAETAKYGIVEARELKPRLFELSGMVEKPDPARAPSDLAIMGRYILPPEIFTILAEARPGVGGEIQLTDALLTLCRRRKLFGYQFTGTRYDLGDRLGFVKAQVGYALKRPDLADSLRNYLKSIL